VTSDREVFLRMLTAYLAKFYKKDNIYAILYYRIYESPSKPVRTCISQPIGLGYCALTDK